MKQYKNLHRLFDLTVLFFIMKKQYHCIHCVACEEQDNVTTHSVYKCQFDGDDKELKFNVGTKIPCTRFIPADYIRALNADSVTR